MAFTVYMVEVEFVCVPEDDKSLISACMCRYMMHLHRDMRYQLQSTSLLHFVRRMLTTM